MHTAVVLMAMHVTEPKQLIPHVNLGSMCQKVPPDVAETSEFHWTMKSTSVASRDIQTQALFGYSSDISLKGEKAVTAYAAKQQHQRQ